MMHSTCAHVCACPRPTCAEYSPSCCSARSTSTANTRSTAASSPAPGPLPPPFAAAAAAAPPPPPPAAPPPAPPLPHSSDASSSAISPNCSACGCESSERWRPGQQAGRRVSAASAPIQSLPPSQHPHTLARLFRQRWRGAHALGAQASPRVPKFAVNSRIADWLTHAFGYCAGSHILDLSLPLLPPLRLEPSMEHSHIQRTGEEAASAVLLAGANGVVPTVPTGRRHSIVVSCSHRSPSTATVPHPRPTYLQHKCVPLPVARPQRPLETLQRQHPRRRTQPHGAAQHLRTCVCSVCVCVCFCVEEHKEDSAQRQCVCVCASMCVCTLASVQHVWGGFAGVHPQRRQWCGGMLQADSAAGQAVPTCGRE